jgi:hypothetical protein
LLIYVLPTIEITSWHRIPVEAVTGENKMTIKDNSINPNLIEWRPANWEGQPRYYARCTAHPTACYICTSGYEDGASAMFIGLIRYLEQANDLKDLDKLFLSLKSSVALTSLMGKFPDLPDVVEDK